MVFFVCFVSILLDFRSGHRAVCVCRRVLNHNDDGKNRSGGGTSEPLSPDFFISKLGV
jgi:hypothetical protein